MGENKRKIKMQTYKKTFKSVEKGRGGRSYLCEGYTGGWAPEGRIMEVISQMFGLVAGSTRGIVAWSRLSLLFLSLGSRAEKGP